jgi:hypothetical protein
MSIPNAAHLTYLKYLPKVVEMLVINGAKSATKFVDRRTVVRAHRVTYRGKINRYEKTLDLRVKIGTPNYHERKFVADCMKANEPFPVKRVRLAFLRNA